MSSPAADATSAGAIVSPSELQVRCAGLERAAAALAAMRLEERIAVVDRVARAWLAPGSPWRRRTLAALPAATGYPPEAIGVALEQLWSALRGGEIATVAARELDGFEGALPERLAFHSLTGNVPGAGVFGVIAALVAGVPSIVKTARREPVLLALIAESIAAEDPRLGAAVAVAHWPGGSEAHETVVLAHSSVVLAYGRGKTLDRLAARAPRRLLRFGPRLSVGLVTRELRDAATAAAAARQVALFDQQGCLSPQYLVVEEDDPDGGNAFAESLAAALQGFATALPRAPLALDEATRTWRYLERQLWREQEGAAVRVLADPTREFSVVSDRTGALPASPLHRHVIVLPVRSLRDAAQLVRRFAGLVEALGVAAPPHRLREAATVATAAGAHRMCPLDRMHAPPFAWRQSGHARLASFFAEPAQPSRSAAPAAGEVREQPPAAGASAHALLDGTTPPSHGATAPQDPTLPTEADAAGGAARTAGGVGGVARAAAGRG